MMAWFAAAIPAITAATTVASTGLAVVQMRQAKAAGEYNARQDEAEAKADADQTAREEEALRRENDSILGRQRAGIAEAGLGFGGTTGLLADQSAALSELDALNLRYQGAIRGTGLLSSAKASRMEGRAKATGYGLMAGGELLRGAGDTYRSTRLVPQE